MLRKFSVENYKNFETRAELDLTAVREYAFNRECITNGLLGKVLLMGPNGSGKSNIGYAMFDIVYTLTEFPSNAAQVDWTSFINGNGDGNDASFSYEFQNGDDIIVYEYHKMSHDMMTYEILKVNGETIFERDLVKKKVDYKGLHLVGAENLRFEPFGGSLPLLRYIGNNTSQPDGSPISFIMDFVRRMLYFRSTQDGNMFIGFERSAEYLDQFIMKNKLEKEFQEFLKENAGLEMELGTVRTKGMPDIFVQKLKKKNLAFGNVASSGTKALELFYYWSKRFDNISLLFIDEFDAFYHFELAEKIMRQVLGYANVQVILTSHNTNLVSTGMMRPDCYLQIKNGEITSLAESTPRELREGHNIEKMLRNGEFE